MEIPELSKDEIRKVACEVLVDAWNAPILFIMEKIGMQGVVEFGKKTAEEYAQEAKERGVNSPLKFVMESAILSKNVLGCDVDVEGNEEKAILYIKKCTTVPIALRKGEKKGMKITKEQYCGGCVGGHWKNVAEELKLKFKAEFTDEGCRLVFEK